MLLNIKSGSDEKEKRNSKNEQIRIRQATTIASIRKVKKKTFTVYSFAAAIKS